MPEWFNPQRGYYIAKYRGRTLEIVRNADSTDKRRYVAQVDGVVVPHPCHTIPQCKTKAMKWADNPIHDTAGESDEETRGPPEPATNNAVVPYVEPELPAVADNPVMMEFRIVGKIPGDRFAHAIAHLKATVDMLREEGAIAECDIEPPARVKL